MAMSRTCINGTKYDIKSGRTCVGSTNYDIKKGRTCIGSTNYDISFGTPLGELATKTSIYMNVDGVRTEWMVAHQGIPDATIYDASCNGTWLLMKDVYTFMRWNGGSNYGQYSEGAIHTYLNGTFLNLLDAGIKAQIQTVKIPYVNVTNGENTATGADGLSTRSFLLSEQEIGFTSRIAIGATLAYFESATNADRIACTNNGAQPWWLRSVRNKGDGSLNYGEYIQSNGTLGSTVNYLARGVRPVLIFDSEETLVDSEFNIISA